MAEKTKLQLQIEASEKKIKAEQNHLKQLERKQTEKDRKDRNHRLCKRHGFIESILPDTISLTDEQFQTFVKQHIANKHGIAAIATLAGKIAETENTAPTEAKTQNGGNQTPTTATQNGATLATKQGETA